MSQPPPSREHHRLRNVLLVSGGVLLLIIVLAVAFGGGRNLGQSAAATQHSASSSAKPSPEPPDRAGTVTFEATGAPSTVNLGRAGSESEQPGPVTVTSRLDSSATEYKLTVSPTAIGTSHCRIKVNGRTLANGSASGSVAIATCVIHQDPMSGSWSADTP